MLRRSRDLEILFSRIIRRILFLFQSKAMQDVNLVVSIGQSSAVTWSSDAADMLVGFVIEGCFPR